MCCAYLLSCVHLFATPWTVARQAPLSTGILQSRILERVAMPSSRWVGWEPAELGGAQAAPWLTGKSTVEA